MLTITPLEQAGVALLPPDVVWAATSGDFALDGRVGLRAANPIQTAILLCLFTDARADADDLRQEHAGDARGWVGDGFDIDASRGETPLGSKLWLFRRHELTDATARLVEAEARRALNTLIRQKLAARIDLTAEAQKAEGRIALSVTVIGSDGRTRAAERFDILWSQVRGL